MARPDLNLRRMIKPAIPIKSKKGIPKWVWIVGLVLAVYFSPLVVIMFDIHRDSVKEKQSRIAFDSETWIKAKTKPRPDAIRLQMVDSLIASHTLEGKSRDEIVKILGEPDGDPSLKKRFPKWDMHYFLGLTRDALLSLSPNDDYLFLRFDGGGKVIDIGIVTVSN